MNTDGFSKLRARPDLSYLQRQRARELRSELQIHIDAGENDFFIDYKNNCVKRRRRVIWNATPSQNLSTPYISNENNFHFVKFLYFNARSLKNKFSTLNLLLKSGIYEFILVTETWLNENTYDAEIVSDSEYCIIRHDRLGKVGGGVAIIFKRLQ